MNPAATSIGAPLIGSLRWPAIAIMTLSVLLAIPGLWLALRMRAKVLASAYPRWRLGVTTAAPHVSIRTGTHFLWATTRGDTDAIGAHLDTITRATRTTEVSKTRLDSILAQTRKDARWNRRAILADSVAPALLVATVLLRVR